jgi:uncharacterized protein
MADQDGIAHYPGRAAIEAYGNGGFRFAGMSHRGSLLFLPGGVWAWAPRRAADLDIGDFVHILADPQGIGVLLVGTGTTQVFLPREVRRAFAEAGIALEAMTTGAAARTYNVLLAEQRQVGAALIAVD